MKYAWVRLAAGLALAGTAATVASASELRFSVSIEPAERVAAGLTRLTSDQVAVLDAFVRRDAANRLSTVAPEVTTQPEKPGPTFSQRLTANERHTAGFATLTPAELTQLDAIVERHQNARLVRTLLAPPSYITHRDRITLSDRKKEREIHGSFSLSYGVGSGGYSEKSGSMVLNLEDPVKGYSISIGYSETHTKGGVPYYLYRDPFYDRLRSPLDDPFRP